MSAEQVDFSECAVCHRNILRGERVTEYLTPERERVPVCTLCKTRAEAMGWTEARFAPAAAVSEAPRRRGFDLRGRLSRRGRGKTADELAREIGIPDRPTGRRDPGLGQEDAFAEQEPAEETGAVVSQEPDPGEDPESADGGESSATSAGPPAVESVDPAPGDPAPADRARPDEPAAEPLPDPERSATDPAEPARRVPRTPARLMRLAVDAFNESPESHKIGGLMRSLGEPHVSVRPPAREDMPALVTVAWELSWYQWEVGVEPDERSVREIAKGNEIGELDDAARHWNARAKEGGRLGLRRSGERTRA